MTEATVGPAVVDALSTWTDSCSKVGKSFVAPLGIAGRAVSLPLNDVTTAMASVLSDVSASLTTIGTSIGAALGGQYFQIASAARQQREAKELRELAALSDGWDGEGSLAPTKDILGTAAWVIARAQDEPGDFEVTPNDSGTISLEWENSRAYALLEIGRRKYSLTIDPAVGAPYFENGTAATLSLDTIFTHLNRALFGAQVFPTNNVQSNTSRPLISNVSRTFYALGA